MLILLLLHFCSIYIHLNTADSYAEEGDYPFEVAIAYRGTDICGGAIVSEYLILTAAHCIRYLDPNDLAIFAGVHNYYVFPRGHKYEVNSTYIHPQYEASTRDYDVALIKLVNALKLNTPGVDSIEIVTTSYVNYGGKLATLVYWELEPGTRLLYTDIELWDQRQCTAGNIFGEFAASIDLPPPNNGIICAGIPAGSICDW